MGKGLEKCLYSCQSLKTAYLTAPKNHLRVSVLEWETLPTGCCIKDILSVVKGD